MMLKLRAALPQAVLKLPMVLLERASLPLAVLRLPVVLLDSASNPLAALRIPRVLLESAAAPSAVLALLPLVVLVRGVQVPPIVAFDPTQVSFPGAAAAMV